MPDFWNSMNTQPLIENLLPHTPPMRLLDTLIAVGEDHVQCQLTVLKSGLFFNPKTKSIPGWVGIEFMAQTVASWSGFQAWKENIPPPLGFLLGSRRYHCSCCDFPEGSVLDIYAIHIMENNGIAAFDCRIELDGENVARAQLNAYIPSKEKLQQMLNRTSV